MPMMEIMLVAVRSYIPRQNKNILQKLLLFSSRDTSCDIDKQGIGVLGVRSL